MSRLDQAGLGQSIEAGGSLYMKRALRGVENIVVVGEGSGQQRGQSLVQGYSAFQASKHFQCGREAASLAQTNKSS